MRIDIATLFPEVCEAYTQASIIGRAQKAGKITICCHHIRDYTLDKHRRVDDTPYGGGKGMLMQADPIYRCYESVTELLPQKPHVIYLSPQGKTFTQQRAVQLAGLEHIFLICGHYEGVDQRVLDEIVDEEISLGDFVLTGGELAALAVADAVARLCEGVLAEEVCFTEESHYNGLLEYPQYTRPPVWHGRAIPELLASGHHKNIETWKRQKSLEATRRKRPELLKTAALTKEDIAFLRQLEQQIADEQAFLQELEQKMAEDQ